MGAIFDDAGKVRDRDALQSIQVNPAGPRRPAVAVDRSAVGDPHQGRATPR